MKKHKSIIFTVLALVVFCLLLCVNGVTADTWGYKFSFSVSDNSETDRTYLPIRTGINGSSIISAGYLNASGNETDVQIGTTGVPYGISDNISIVIDSLLAYQEKEYDLYTGYSPGAEQDIIVGNGGYVTIADAAALELGNNFKTEFTGYIDTSAADAEIITKPDAFYLYTSDVGELSAYFPAAGAAQSIEQTTNPSNDSIYRGKRAAQRIDSFSGLITSVQFNLRRFNSPTGTGYARVRSVSDDSIIGTLGSIDVSTITTDSSAAWYTFNTSSVLVSASQDIYVTFEYEDGNSSNYTYSRYNTSDTVTGYRSVYDSSWTDYPTHDRAIKVYYKDITLKTVTATGVTSGSYKIEVYADGTNLKMEIDDLTEDAVALSGASVLDNNNDWLLYPDPCWEYYEHTVSGTLVVNYNPIEIITGTTLPDLEGATQNGTITWGTNPDNIVIEYLGMESYESTTQTGSGEGELPEVVLDPSGSDDWFASGTFSGVLTPEIKEVFATKAAEMGMEERSLWLMIMFGVATAVGLSVLLYTGSVMITIFVVAATLAASWSTGIVDFGLVITAIIFMIGIYYLARQH